MVKVYETKITRPKEKGSYLIWLPVRLVDDSAFPLDLEKRVLLKIEGKRLIIEQA